MERSPTPRRAISTLLCATTLAAATCLAGTPSGPAADPLAGARKLTLDNGLRLILKVDRTHPVVAVQMLYTVGARNETIGITGISHFLEHMLFRGTKGFPLQDVTGVIERAGGEWHGYTYIDCTTYFQAAPSALLPTLLRLEAERMTDARMAADEVEPERGAVFQEYRGYQLDPRSDLFDAVTATLFLAHPYRNNTMGWESDLAGITHEDLVAYYRAYYAPGNAILAIAGDFDETTVEREVRSLFGAIRAGGADTLIRTVEPPITGARRVTLRRPGADPALMVSFVAPAPSKAREYARLMVLDAVLGSAKGLSFYRHSSDLTEGAPADPGSRLAAMAADGPADHVGTALVPTLYPYQYAIYATPREGRPLEEIEPLIHEILARAAAGVSEDEVRGAVARILAADLLETDAPVEVAHEMAFWTAIGGLDLRRDILKEIGLMTPGEVQALAARLTPDRAVVGVVLPEQDAPQPQAGRAEAGEVSARGGGTSRAGPSPKAPQRAATTEVRTRRLSRDTRAIIDARPDLRTFVFRLALRAPGGGTEAKAQARLHAAAAALRRDRDARRRLIEHGVRLSVEAPGDGLFAERDTLQVQAAGPAGALTGAIDILAPALGRAFGLTEATPGSPDVPPSDDPGERAVQMLAQAAATGTARGDRRAAITLVSPFSSATIEPWLRRLIRTVPAADGRGDMQGEGDGSPFGPGRRTATIRDISQGNLTLVVPGDDDVMAQEAVAWLMHHNYSGRLGAKAITETGLVYDMDSESVRRGTRLAYFTMGADPSSLDRLESALVEVLDSAVSGFTEEEVGEFRSYASGSMVVRLADPAQAARFHLSALLRGEDDRGPAAFARDASRLSRERVSAAARRMLDPARRLVIVVGRAAP